MTNKTELNGRTDGRTIGRTADPKTCSLHLRIFHDGGKIDPQYFIVIIAYWFLCVCWLRHQLGERWLFWWPVAVLRYHHYIVFTVSVVQLANKLIDWLIVIVVVVVMFTGLFLDTLCIVVSVCPHCTILFNSGCYIWWNKVNIWDMNVSSHVLSFFRTASSRVAERTRANTSTISTFARRVLRANVVDMVDVHTSSEK